MKIPKNMFKTHKSMNFILEHDSLRTADKSWSKWKNKGFNYYFYNNDMCNKFMDEYFPEIKDVYDRLPLAVMKADLWRYCIIYKYGGIYHDADTELKVNPSFLTNYDNKYLIVVPENNTHFCQWVFAAPANSPVLKSIIDLSVERIRNCKEIRGEHIIHYLTGPGVFTDGIFKYLKTPPMTTMEVTDGILKYLNADKNPIKYGKEGGILKYGLGFVKKNIGSSGTNSKTVKINNILDTNKELSFIHNYNDHFSYKFNKDKLTIKRIDTYTGWGQNLDVYQFNSMSNILIMPYNLFHGNWIKHLFSGQWSDGWCKERYKYLM